MGKPVIATDIPCHQGISKSVLLTPDNSPKAIAEAIIRYRNLTATEKIELKDSALLDAQKYTWQAHARTLDRFIREEVLPGAMKNYPPDNQ